jgi:ribosomal-protein-serine acetyltransferase
VGRLELSGHSYLRLLQESDAAELYALIDADREQLAQWLPWAARQTAADTVEFIRGGRQQVARNDGFQAAVVREERIVGVIGFARVDWENRATTLGYWLSRASQGTGLMTDAVRVLTDHALSTWELTRVEIRAAAENTRSRAIPERLGFAEEGLLRGAERVGDRQLDLIVYAMLASSQLAL